MPTRWSIGWLGWLIVTVFVGALLAVGIVTAVNAWYLTDLKAYLEAARLLAAGGNPFDVALLERGLPYYYHYSPWFAAVLIPLTWVPLDVVRVGWSGVLIGASVAALLPLVRSYGVVAAPLVGLMAFLLLNLVAEGNVQPLLLAGLVWTLERRAGPLMVGVAASLKIAPILLALVYAGRHEWRRAVVAGVVAGLLVGPTLLFDLPATAVDTGGTGLFTAAPALWAGLVLLGIIVTVMLARSRFGWLSASVTTVLALPRLLIFDITNLLAAIPVHQGRPTRR